MRRDLERRLARVETAMKPQAFGLEWLGGLGPLWARAVEIRHGMTPPRPLRLTAAKEARAGDMTEDFDF